MDARWHIAFCNVTFTEYAGVRYRDYYGSPATMLEAQLAAKEFAEHRFGVGGFISPLVDSPPCAFASYLGMPVLTPEVDELPYIDSTRPLLTDPGQLSELRIGDPKTSGLMADRWEAWQYYTSHGHATAFGGHSGGIVTVAGEISSGAIFEWAAARPEDARRVFDFVAEAETAIATFGASLSGREHSGFTYVGDDYAGLLSPRMFREFAIPVYRRLYSEQTVRFMHSELLRAEHLGIARDELGITEFHGAGCVNVTPEEMHEIMGHRFWLQVTPQELLELSPAALGNRIREYAQSGAAYVQLYPGRGTPDRNMEAAISAAQRECPGGPLW